MIRRHCADGAGGVKKREKARGRESRLKRRSAAPIGACGRDCKVAARRIGTDRRDHPLGGYLPPQVGAPGRWRPNGTAMSANACESAGSITQPSPASGLTEADSAPGLHATPRAGLLHKLYLPGCRACDFIANLAGHPLASVVLIAGCLLGLAAMGQAGQNLLTLILSILAITLTQMVLNQARWCSIRGVAANWHCSTFSSTNCSPRLIARATNWPGSSMPTRTPCELPAAARPTKWLDRGEPALLALQDK